MKKTIFTLLSLLCAVSVFAQNNELAEKVTSLEEKVSTLEHAIASMQTKVDEVTHQNLALKQAISLQPTIAECTSESGINYRLISTTGNSRTGKITLVISVLNPTKRDIKANFENYPTMVDEKGYSYIGHQDIESATIANECLPCGSVLMPDTPVEMKLIFVSNTEPQYLKSFDLKSMGFENHSFRFTNIPIKWE